MAIPVSGASRRPPPRGDTRRAARSGALLAFAVAMTALTGVAYLVIGARIVTVLENPADQTVFGLIAGGGYLVATVVLAWFPRLWVFLLGVALQTFVIAQYLNLAPQRVPSYEVWGLALRVPQLLLLVALMVLAWRRMRRGSDVSGGGPR